MQVQFSHKCIIGWFFLLAIGLYPVARQTAIAQPAIPIIIEKDRFGVFSDAKALSISADGRITVIDGGAEAVVILGPSGEVERSLNGRGWGQLEFDQPADGDASPTLRIYIADYGNARVQVFDNNLNYVSTLDGRSPEDDGSDRFRYPRSVAVSRHNDVFVLDGDNARIIKLDISGTLQGTFGGFDAGKGRLLQPSRIRISPQDILCVIDGNDVLFFDLYGNFLTRHHGSDPVNGCAPFMSGLEWMIASDSTLTILEPEITGCKIYGSIRYRDVDIVWPVQKENGTSPQTAVVRDLAIRENILYLLTSHEIVLYTITNKK